MADWSGVFEENGEEGGDWEREPSCDSSRAGILQLLDNYNPIVAYFFTVNYILGVGCLGIPFAFYKAGVALASVLIIFVSFVSYVTVLLVAEASDRGMHLRRERLSKNPFRSQSHLDIKKSGNKTYFSLDPWFNNENSASKHVGGDVRRRTVSAESVLNEENGGLLEVTELASEYLGSWGKHGYQFALTMLSFIGLLAYVQVFNDSFRSQIWPECSSYFSALLFGAVVVPFSCFDLAEQITAQVIMSLLRFLSLGILFVGTAIAWSINPPADHFTSISSSSSDNNHAVGGVHSEESLVKLSGIGVMFTTAIFSQLFQHSVPGLLKPLSAQDKSQAKKIFGGALFTTAAIYLLIGCTCSLYFGSDTKPSINLNFVGFYWGVQPGSSLHPIVALASMLIVLFPALDTLSVFPLIVNTLSTNLAAAFPIVGKSLRSYLHNYEKKTVKRIATILWRLIVAIPPVVLSVFILDLSVSLQLAGICGIFVALVTPALLQIQSEARINEVPVAYRLTPYTSLSRRNISIGILVLAALATVVCLSQMLI